MTLRPPVIVTPGKCTCSGAECVCAPTDFAAKYDESRRAYYAAWSARELRADAANVEPLQQRFAASLAELNAATTPKPKPSTTMQHANTDSFPTPEEREQRIAVTAENLDRYSPGAPFPTGDALRADLAGRSDAAVRSRCDSLDELAPGWKRDAALGEIARAAERASRQHAYRAQAFRADAKGAPSQPSYPVTGASWLRVQYPPGFDPELTVAVLQASGLDAFLLTHAGAMYRSVASALQAQDHAYLIGALQKILDGVSVDDKIVPLMAKAGYAPAVIAGLGLRGWRRGTVDQSLAAARATATRADEADATREARARAWNEQWKRGPLGREEM